MTAARLLVIASHRDDEALSCGGLILNTLRDSSAVVKVATMHNRTYYGNEDPEQDALLDLRDKNWFRKAANLLGYQFDNHHGLKEGEPNSLSMIEAIHAVEWEIDSFKPTIMAIPGPRDLNQDHRFDHEVCKIALRPATLMKHPQLTKVLMWRAFDSPPHPAQHYEVMTEMHQHLKQQAIAVYESEAREVPHPRSLTSIASHATYYGSQVGRFSAEPYDVHLSLSDHQ